MRERLETMCVCVSFLASKVKESSSSFLKFSNLVELFFPHFPYPRLRTFVLCSKNFLQPHTETNSTSSKEKLSFAPFDRRTLRLTNPSYPEKRIRPDDK